MHLLITYPDGSTETVEASLEGDWVMRGPKWGPGIRTADPERCHFRRDFFEAAINEADERQGSVAPDPDDGEAADAFERFEWKLVGTEEEECRSKLAAWARAIGHAFDPSKDSSQAIPDAPEDIRSGYDLDRQCWETYLADPADELDALLTAQAEKEADAAGPKH